MKKSNKRLIFRSLLAILLSCIIGFGFYASTNRNIGGDSMPMPFGSAVAVVLSGSMEPVLSVDDLIYVREAENYEVGDIVVYLDGRMLVVHEIIQKNGDIVITQGRFTGVPDDPIHVRCIKGKVIWSIPYVGRLVTIIQSPMVSMLMLALAGYLMLRSYRNDANDAKQKREELQQQIEELKKQK